MGGGGQDSSFSNGALFELQKVVVGVCVMEKKALSGPMTEILRRLQDFGEFEVIVFGDKVILDDPVEKWPICDCLIAFYSTGFPLEKAEAYAALRKPFLVNDLGSQHLLHDRRKVYSQLEEYGISTPPYALVNRDYPDQDLDYFKEEEDYVEVHGKRIMKPFVEKPVDGDNHSVMIYYPSSAGGGMKELFRKVGNRSSEFHPQLRRVRRGGSYIYEAFMPTGGTDVKYFYTTTADLNKLGLGSTCFDKTHVHGPELSQGGYYANEGQATNVEVVERSSEFYPDTRRVRRGGSYIYEEFLITGGTDVKVYTVGSQYAHAEARKSPVVDGVVMRSADGKEVRYPVLLTPSEKEMARDVVVAFGQAVCGFDLLRSQGKSYVCDVNGWSFVKNSYKYYDDAAVVLRTMFLKARAPHLSSTLPSLPWHTEPVRTGGMSRQGSTVLTGTFGQSEELRCVIAVLRHGDRTPKQKVKMKVTQNKLLDLMLKYNGNRPRAEAKLKSAVQLQDLLDATRALVPRARSGKESDSEAEDLEHAEKLRHVKAVLEEGGHFSGIYRKVQLKPQKWTMVSSDDEDSEQEKPSEALMVLKYGGVLTHAGRKQAEEFGRAFRNTMYPGEGTGLLRLHSTYRHDLKIYSSDEGRVQMSAAAFAKGLLDLEGQLTPILVSLVSKDSPMLDGLDTASIEMEEAKARLYEIITGEDQTAPTSMTEFPWMVDGGGLPAGSLKLLERLVELTAQVTAQVKTLCKAEEERLAETSLDEDLPPYDQARALGKTNMDVDRIAAGLPCGSEGFLLMYARWKKLERDVFNERKGRFDISKIPDIYDSAKYDLLHNAHLDLDGLDELYKVAKALADGVIPNEYGINPKHKLKIGSKIARRLLGKILIDLRNTREEAVSVATPESSEADSPLRTHSTSLEDMPAKPCEKANGKIKVDVSRRSSTSEKSSDPDEDDDKEAQYRLDPKYANVRTPERHVRTRLYFTSESHIHSLINVLRYCYLDDSFQGEAGLVSNDALLRVFQIKELDYMTHIVLRMYENTEVSLDDPRRFRIELMFSCGSALSPLEASPLQRDHTLPVLPSETLQEEGSFLSLDRLEKLIRPFAMPAEDFPPATTPQGFSGLFMKGGGVLERLVNLWPFHKHANIKA